MQRCAPQTFPWDAAAYLAAATDWCSGQEVARALRLSDQEMLAQLEVLLQAGLVQERLPVTGPSYRFVGSRRLRTFFRAVRLPGPEREVPAGAIGLPPATGG
ncbi:MAG: hypothetical protein ACP5UQ_04275 [Anaerolineae bacterium]